jgi:molybdenum cofactor cytidylyltransferase
VIASAPSAGEEIEGVVLAAGLSSRSGRYKMALPLGGKTVIEKSIEGMYDIASRIVVVTGWRAERVRELLAAYDKVEIVLNANFRAGMFGSVKAGIARVRAPRFFLLPGDHPLIEARVYAQMLTVAGEIVIPTCEGRKGHPVLFQSHLIPEILDRPDESTLRDYILSKGYVTTEVEDRGILLDIDTPEDYDAIRGFVRGAG